MKQRRLRLVAGVVALLVLASRATAGPVSRVDDLGRLDRLAMGAGWAQVSTEVRVYAKGWSRNASLSSAPDMKSATNGEARVWTATLAPNRNEGAAVRVVQSVREEAGKVRFEIQATALREGEIEGLVFLVNLPAEDFAGGSLTAAEKTMALPEKLPPDIHLWNGQAGTIVFTNATQRTRVTLEASPALNVTVQDGRRWAQEFTAMLYLQRGNLSSNQSVRAALTLAAKGQADQTPATAAVDATQVRYRVAGMGGNYCFAIESPVTRYTLDHLEVRAARTEMSLKLWAPKPIPAGLADADYQPYAVADVPDSRIRRELELMRELQRRGIPFTISVWRMPPWLAELVSREGWQERWRITPTHWPAVLHAVGAYLLYAREKYQVEPNYFSFNEANLGVDALMTAEEHREAIQRLGAHFAKLGLKTRLLLGDVAGPRGTVTYAEPAANDAEARKYLGAVSFHSWGGARPEQYAAWGDLAERLKLPLLVAEAGPDAGAWQTRAYRTFPYAVREMVHYQELLLYARPQSILYWEFTGDYSLLAANRPAPDGSGLTERFCFQKHWCNLIPPGSEALATHCQTDGVLVTAFRAGKDYTIHISNAKWERPISISGLPEGGSAFHAVRTAEQEYFRELGPVPVRLGKLKVTLPAESLTTLTTLRTASNP